MVDFSSYAQSSGLKYGISPSFLSATVKMEGTPNNLFGFQGGAARDFGFNTSSDFLNIGKQFDSGAAYAAKNAKTLGGLLGRAPNDFELYLAHWQGASGAANILKNPGASAADTVLNPFANGVTGGMTNQDWLNKAMSRWTSAGGGFGAGMTGGDIGGALAGALGGVAGGKEGGTALEAIDVPAATDTSSMGWADYIVHQGVRAGVFALGTVFIAMGLLIFAFGGLPQAPVARASANAPDIPPVEIPPPDVRKKKRRLKRGRAGKAT